MLPKVVVLIVAAIIPVSLHTSAGAAGVGLALRAPTPSKKFTVTSTDMANGKLVRDDQVLNGLGCRGGNNSPEVNWENAPANTRSFAVTLFDPDAPTGRGWWHWIAVDIPASVHELPKGAGKDTGNLPVGGRQIRTDFGRPGYGGPCPPKGDKQHRYVLTVDALDTDKLGVPDDASGTIVESNLHAHTLASASITALYGVG
jgi:Raf kinase inhibitor-like YbhB/YbcL family protein